MSQRSYSEDVRLQAIARALEPNTTITQVARDVGCSLTTLHSWLKQHRQQDYPSVVSQEKATFIPVNVVDDRNHSVEIVTPHGIIVRLTNASPQYIAELLNAFASC